MPWLLCAQRILSGCVFACVPRVQSARSLPLLPAHRPGATERFPMNAACGPRHTRRAYGVLWQENSGRPKSGTVCSPRPHTQDPRCHRLRQRQAAGRLPFAASRPAEQKHKQQQQHHQQQQRYRCTVVQWPGVARCAGGTRAAESDPENQNQKCKRPRPTNPLLACPRARGPVVLCGSRGCCCLQPPINQSFFILAHHTLSFPLLDPHHLRISQPPPPPPHTHATPPPLSLYTTRTNASTPTPRPLTAARARTPTHPRGQPTPAITVREANPANCPARFIQHPTHPPSPPLHPPPPSITVARWLWLVIVLHSSRHLHTSATLCTGCRTPGPPKQLER